MKFGVPRGNVLAPILYVLCTCSLPQIANVTIATFVEDTNTENATNDQTQLIDK